MCIYIYIYIYTGTRVSLSLSLCISLYYIYIYININIYIYIYIHTHRRPLSRRRARGFPKPPRVVGSKGPSSTSGSSLKSRFIKGGCSGNRV